MTRIDAATLAAYRRAHYRVTGAPPTFVLRVNRRSALLAALLHARGARSAAFVTAWNPRGRACRPARNARAQQRLLDRLARQGYAAIAGVGGSADGAWSEDSLLVPGMSLRAARQLGRACGQNAVLWTGPDARPRLVLLR